MAKQLKKNEKVQIALFSIAVALIILGILFLVNAMQEDPANGFFPAFCEISNVLAKYIVVILTMASGIMMFSNVAITLENRKLRNGLTIGITTFSTILTIPLVYVFFALMPFAANPKPFEQLNAVDKVMRTDRIFEGFTAWFGDGALMWVVLSLMLILSLVFIAFPLVTGVLAVKGKTIKVGKTSKGKFGAEIAPLPVIVRLNASEKECTSTDLDALAAQMAADNSEE